MPDEYITIQQGDSIDSLSYVRGLFPQSVWNHAENAELKKLRKDPNVLKAGDVVFFPELVPKTVDCVTEKLHSFRRKAVPARIGFKLLDDRGQPRANLRYVLRIDHKLFDGTTDAEGTVEFDVPPNAQVAILKLTETDEEFNLGIGHMDPIDTDSGLAHRLSNLGFPVTLTDGEPEPDSLAAALYAFQNHNKLEATGEANDPTKEKLKELAGY